jgi:hypothetical protein
MIDTLLGRVRYSERLLSIHVICYGWERVESIGEIVHSAV